MKNRVVWKMFLLTIVTLGIYRLYWFIKTRQEMMALNPKVKILSPVLLVIPIVIVIFSFIWLMTSAIQTGVNQPSYCKTSNQTYSSYSTITPSKECQTSPAIAPMVFFYISLLVIWPLAIVWLWSYSRGVETVTGGKTSFAISLLVLLVVPDGIDILIIQDGFNKLSPAKT